MIFGPPLATDGGEEGEGKQVAMEDRGKVIPSSVRIAISP